MGALFAGLSCALFASASRAAMRAGRCPATSAEGPARSLPVPEALRLGLAAGLCALALGPAGVILGPLLVLLARRLKAMRAARASRSSGAEQLADAVGALSSSVRAGMSVPQAIAYAAGEAEPPLSEHLARLVEDLEIGVPMVDAVQGWANRVDTDDARLLASVLELHRMTGGDLTLVLDQVGATIRERVFARREVRALTAQARLSGLILGLLPVGFFAFLWLTSRSDMQEALSTSAGAASVVLGLLMEGVAFLWIRRLLEVG